MTNKDKIIIVLDRQSNDSTVTQIAKELEMTVPKLKEFMKNEGYTYSNGIFLKSSESNSNKEEQLSLGSIDLDTTAKSKSKSKKKKVKADATEESNQEEVKKIEVELNTLQKLEYIYETFFYASEKKNRPKPNKKTKEVYIEDNLIEESKRITVKVDGQLLERLERLVTNTNQDRDLIINQALLDLLNDYNHLN